MKIFTWIYCYDKKRRTEGHATKLQFDTKRINLVFSALREIVKYNSNVFYKIEYWESKNIIRTCKAYILCREYLNGKRRFYSYALPIKWLISPQDAKNSEVIEELYVQLGLLLQCSQG